MLATKNTKNHKNGNLLFVPFRVLCGYSAFLCLDEAASPRAGGAVLTVVRDVGLLNVQCSSV